MIRHNVDLSRLMGFVEDARSDPARARKVQVVEGVWNVGEGPQFSAEIPFEGGRQVADADQPSLQGGGGRARNPMLYCLFGLASCYGATFAAMAAMENVQIRALRVRAQANVNHSRALGLSSDPPIERITLIVSADSSASVETLKRIREEAWKRCPAVYCVTNPVRLEVSVEAKA
jgi:uncharacterized OsmC-like protein